MAKHRKRAKAQGIRTSTQAVIYAATSFLKAELTPEQFNNHDIPDTAEYCGEGKWSVCFLDRVREARGVCPSETFVTVNDETGEIEFGYMI